MRDSKVVLQLRTAVQMAYVYVCIDRTHVVINITYFAAVYW